MVLSLLQRTKRGVLYFLNGNQYIETNPSFLAMRDINFKGYTFTEYTDSKQVKSTTPSIFIIATRKSDITMSLDKGFLTSNPYEIISLDSGYPILRENEILLLLKHDFQTAEELLPIVLDLMEYYPISYYDLDTTHPIELDELKELLLHK